MAAEKVYGMSLTKVYPLLVGKAERKGRTKAEVDEIIGWLTGYSPEQVQDCLKSDVTYGDFFLQAPALHPNRPGSSTMAERSSRSWVRRERRNSSTHAAEQP